MSTNFTDPDAIPPVDVPWFQQREHYGAIVAVLKAWELDAHISTNGLVLTVHVKLEDGREVVWSNITEGELWAWSSVEAEGDIKTQTTELAGTTEAEEVARAITEADYGGGARPDKPLLLWCDLEATGPTVSDPIIEIAIIITDWGLKVIAESAWIVDPHPIDWMGILDHNEVVRDMHVANGLVGELLAGAGVRSNKVEGEIVAMLDAYGSPGSFILSGFGVEWFDSKMLEVQMPKVADYFTKTILDIETFREFFEKACGRIDLLPDQPERPHRAPADIWLHLEEAQHYRSLIQSVAA